MSADRSDWEERYRGKTGCAIRQPSAFLEEHVQLLARGRALDVACGGGRNALFLAEHGFVVEAIDFVSAGFKAGQRVAQQQRLALRFIQADLETFPLPKERYTAVVNIRYLQRSLWPSIKRAVFDGGIILFETFLHEQQQLGHSRNPSFLLKRGELADAFRDFELLLYEEGLFDGESGPAYLARMLARRPPGWCAD